MQTRERENIENWHETLDIGEKRLYIKIYHKQTKTPQNAQTAKSDFFNLGETRSETLVRNPYVSSSHKIGKL